MEAAAPEQEQQGQQQPATGVEAAAPEHAPEQEQQGQQEPASGVEAAAPEHVEAAAPAQEQQGQQQPASGAGGGDATDAGAGGGGGGRAGAAGEGCIGTGAAARGKKRQRTPVEDELNWRDAKLSDQFYHRLRTDYYHVFEGEVVSWCTCSTRTYPACVCPATRRMTFPVAWVQVLCKPQAESVVLLTGLNRILCVSPLVSSLPINEILCTHVSSHCSLGATMFRFDGRMDD